MATTVEVLKSVLRIEDLFTAELKKYNTEVKRSADLSEKRFAEIEKSVNDVGRSIDRSSDRASRFGKVLLGLGAGFGVFLLGKVAVGGFFAAMRGGARAVETVFRASLRVGRELIDQFNETRASLDGLGKIGTRLGIAPQALRELRFAGEQAGVATNQLDLALQRMTRRLGEAAATGRGEAVPALAALNIPIEKFIGLQPDKQFELVAEALSKVEDPSRRLALAFKFFDSEGTSVLQLIDQGVPRIRALREEARLLGGSFSKLDIAPVEAMNDEIAKMQFGVRALKEQVAVDLAPTLRDAARELKEAFIDARPTILGVLRGIPGAARVAFEAVRKDGPAILSKTFDVVLEVGLFAFGRLADGLGVAFDGALATIEQKFATKFAGFRKFLVGIGVIDKSEIDRSLELLDQIKARAETIVIGRTALRGNVGKDLFDSLLRGIKEVEIAGDKLGQTRGFKIMRDEAGQIASILEKSTGKLTEFTRSATGEIIGLTNTVNGQVERIGVTAADRVAESFDGFVERSKARLRELGESLSKIGNRKFGGGESLVGIGDRIAAEFEKSIASTKKQVEEQKRVDAAFAGTLAVARSLGFVYDDAGAAATRFVIAQMQATEAERALAEASKLRLAARGDLIGELQTLEERVRLLRVESEQGAIAAEVERLRTLAKLAGVAATEQQIEAVRRLLEEEDRLNEKIRERETSQRESGLAIIRQYQDIGEEVKRVANNIIQATESLLTDALVSIAEKTKSAKDALKDFAREFLRTLGRIAINAAVRGLLGGIGGALGLGGGGNNKSGNQGARGLIVPHGTRPGVRTDYSKFARGGLPDHKHVSRYMARGSVVTKPTLFNLPDGGIGQVRESLRDEAVLPLQKTRNGDLGVKAVVGPRQSAPSMVDARRIDARTSLVVEAGASVDVAQMESVLKRHEQRIEDKVLSVMGNSPAAGAIINSRVRDRR